MLWDVGFKVGHATRSIVEATNLANSDMLTKTSLLESRYLAGDRRLHSKFRRDFFEHCVRGRVESYLTWRLENQEERHRKYGGSVFMQEPNVKNGCGGLRDYHNMQWICYFRDGVMSTAKLVERKYILRRVVPIQPLPVLYVEHFYQRGVDLFRGSAKWIWRGLWRSGRTGCTCRPRPPG